MATIVDVDSHEEKEQHAKMNYQVLNARTLIYWSWDLQLSAAGKFSEILDWRIRIIDPAH